MNFLFTKFNSFSIHLNGHITFSYEWTLSQLCFQVFTSYEHITFSSNLAQNYNISRLCSLLILEYLVSKPNWIKGSNNSSLLPVVQPEFNMSIYNFKKINLTHMTFNSLTKTNLKSLKNYTFNVYLKSFVFSMKLQCQMDP